MDSARRKQNLAPARTTALAVTSGTLALLMKYLRILSRSREAAAMRMGCGCGCRCGGSDGSDGSGRCGAGMSELLGGALL